MNRAKPPSLCFCTFQSKVNQVLWCIKRWKPFTPLYCIVNWLCSLCSGKCIFQLINYMFHAQFTVYFYSILFYIYNYTWSTGIFFVSIEQKILNCKPCNSMFLFQLVNCQNWFHLSLFSNQYEYMQLEEDRYCFIHFPAQNFFGSIKSRHTFEATAVLVEFHSNEWEIDGYMCIA